MSIIPPTQLLHNSIPVYHKINPNILYEDLKWVHNHHDDQTDPSSLQSSLQSSLDTFNSLNSLNTLNTLNSDSNWMNVFPKKKKEIGSLKRLLDLISKDSKILESANKNVDDLQKYLEKHPNKFEIARNGRALYRYFLLKQHQKQHPEEYNLYRKASQTFNRLCQLYQKEESNNFYKKKENPQEVLDALFRLTSKDPHILELGMHKILFIYF